METISEYAKRLGPEKTATPGSKSVRVVLFLQPEDYAMVKTIADAADTRPAFLIRKWVKARIKAQA
jgi:hypothetical protein